MAELIREISDAGLSSREGCGNTVRNVTGDPWAGVSDGRALRHHPLRGRLRPLLRPPPDDAADAAQGEDRLHGHRRGRRDHRHPRHRLHPARARRRPRASRSGSAAAPRSCRAIAPTLYDFVELDNGDYLKVSEAVLPDLRPPGVAARQPRPRPDQGADRQDRHRRLPRDGRGGARGRLGRRARLLDRATCVYVDDEEAQRARRRRPRPRARTATAREFDALPSTPTSRPQRQEGFSTVEVKVTRGDLTPEQFRGLGQIMREFTGGYARTHRAAELRPALGPRRGALRRLAAARRARPRRAPAPSEITDVVRCPGTDSCKLGITSSMGLNRGDPGAGRVDADHRPADQADPHQDVAAARTAAASTTSPTSASTAPRSRSAAARCPPTSRTSAATTRAARSSTATGSRRGCPPSASPTRSSAGCGSTRPSATTARQFNDFVERVGTARFEEEVKDLTLPAEFSLETMSQFIDWNRSEPYKVERGEGECAV